MMRQNHVAGDKAFVDYSGKRIGIADPATGEIREAEIFVAVLGASNLTYAEATWTQQLDTTTASGRMVFGIFATLAEFERDLIRERTMAGLAAARARGRKGGRKFALTKAQVCLAQAAMAQRDTSVSDLCKELGIERVTLYRYVSPKGELRDYGRRVLG